jgi:hypothetical protein
LRFSIHFRGRTELFFGQLHHTISWAAPQTLTLARK